MAWPYRMHWCDSCRRFRPAERSLKNTQEHCRGCGAHVRKEGQQDE